MGAGQTWAQIDVTSKYLTNPSFESGDMTGWSVATKTNGSEQAITVGAYGSTSEDFGVFSDRGGTAASGSYVMKFSQWWSQYAAIYQTSPVTLPAGTYRLTANLQNHEKREGGHGNYTLGYIAGSVTTTEAPLTFTEYVNGTFAEALQGTVVAKEFTLATDTEVTFAAQSEVWGWHIFQADDFKLYRLTDVTSLVDNADFEGSYTTPHHPNGDRDITQPDGWTLTYTNGATYDSSILKETQATYSNISGTVSIPADGRGAQTYAVRFHNNNNNQLITLHQSKVLPRGRYTISGSFRTSNQDRIETGFYVSSYSDANRTKFTGGSSSWGTLTKTFDSDGETATTYGVFFKHTYKEQNVAGVDNITLAFEPLADDDDYSELNAAISTVEGYTLGFDAGEYASYNVLPILNAAKAINQETNNLYSTVRDFIDALNAITPNATEVNAIFDGSFEHDYSGIAGNVQPLGWYRVKNNASDGYNVRYTTKATNAGVDYTSSDCALFTKLQAYYGWDADYTMPLKANTYYTISFLAGGAGDCDDKTDYIKITNPSDETTQIHSFAVPNATANTVASSDSWISVSATFRTGAAGNYVLGLVPRNNGNKTQNQFLYGDITLVRATAAEIKPFLSAEITAANAIYNSGANVGTGVFQVPTAAGDDFNTAINTTAQGVYDNASATVAEVTTAIDNLKAAEETYANTTLNAPADGKKYYIKVATSGHAKENNAWLTFFSAIETNNPTGYKIQANNAPTDYLAQAYTFTRVSGNTYNISIAMPEGEVYLTYGSLNSSPAGWATSQIQATTDAEDKGGFKIVATNTANVFNIVNTETSSTIACQDAGNIYTEAGNANFAVEEASQATVNVYITETVKYGTRIFPFTPSLPSGVTAYSCTASDGDVLTLVKVAEPQANTPYILEALEGCASTDLEGWGTASADNYTAGWLTGVYTQKDATDGTYVLQNNYGKVGFYKVDTDDVTPKVGAYRCYLSVSSGVRPAFFFSDETTGIDAINGLTSGSATIYSVDGHQLPALQKGLNIVKTNGKTYKVMVK